MKKAIILLCVAWALLLTACGETPGSSDKASGVPGETKPYVLKVAPEDRNQAFLGQSFVETPDGYYCGCWDSTIGEEMIYFCPRDGDAFRPLCGKPNCKHGDRNCNAHAGHGFGYYDGALYSVVSSDTNFAKELDIVKINLDGTDHRVVAAVDLSEVPQSGKSCMFHHGKLVIWCNASDTLPVEEQKDHLIVFDLSNFSQTEPAADYFRTARTPGFFHYYKDKMYGYGDGRDNFNCKSENKRLIEVDMNTGEVRMPLSGYVDGVYMTDSTWYYFVPFEYGTETWTPGFHEYDVKSGAIKDCGLPVEDVLWMCADVDYIYAGGHYRNNNQDKTIYFFSRDYEMLGNIELKGNRMLAAAASDRVFVYDLDTDKITHYIDKSQIGTGELELIPIKTVG